MALRLRWCFGDYPVPLDPVLAEFEDIHDLAPGESASEQTFFLLNLHATAKAQWLEKALGMPWRWWSKHHRHVPLLTDIKESIEQGKKRKGGASRLPKQPSLVVAIEVRGKVLFAKNSPQGPTLALKSGQEEEVLSWLVAELLKDVREVLEKESASTSTPGSSSASASTALVPSELLPADSQEFEEEEDEDEQQNKLDFLVQDVIKDLQDVDQCLKAHWFPSKRSIKVVRKPDKAVRFFRVVNLAKKQRVASDRADDAAWGEVQTLFDKTLQQAIDWVAGSLKPIEE